MRNHLPSSDDQSDVPVPTPFPPGKIASCPLCGLDLTARSVHYVRGLGVCLDCVSHSHPAQLRRYVRSFAHHVRPSDCATYKGMTFWLPSFAVTSDGLPSWLQCVPESTQTALLAHPLLNPDWIERDRLFDDHRRTAAIGAICRDLADERGRPVGGYQPRFKPIAIPDQAEDLRRQVQDVLDFD